MAGWEDLYKPDVGVPALDQLARASKYLEAGLGTIGPASKLDQVVPGLPGGVAQNIANPPNVPPMEMQAMGPRPDVGAPRVSATLGQPTPAPTPRTVSPTVDPGAIDMGKFMPWYQQGVKMGLHPDPNHPDMNVNLQHLFAMGNQWTQGEGGAPGLIDPAGKFTPITPNKFAMTTAPPVSATPKAAPAATPVSSAIAPQPQVTAPASSAIAAPATPEVILQPASALPGREVAPPAVIPGMGTAAAPSVATPGKALEVPAPDEFGGKALTVGGMLASAIDPKQFGQAGQMMMAFGEKELAKARADAAAQGAGYPSALAMEAAKAKAGIAKTEAETAVDRVRMPYIESMTQENLAKLPGIGYRDALVKAQADFQGIVNDYKRMMPPQPVTDPLTGRTVMVDGEHTFASMVSANNSLTNFIGTQASAGHARALTDLDKQKFVNLSQKIPVTLADGTQVNYDIPQYITMMSRNPEWKEKNAAKLNLYHTVIDPIKEAYKNAYPGRPIVLDAGLKRAASAAAQQLANDPDPMWRNQAIMLSAIAGIMPPSTGPKASTALGGKPPISPTEAAAELARRGVK